MNEFNCEYVREVYPDVLHGQAEAATVAAVRAHLDACAECREEAELIELLLSVRQQVPAGLHDRVVTTLQTAPRRSRFPRKYMALAATLAAALIGGSLLLDTTQPTDPRAGAESPKNGGLGVITVEAAMVTGTGSLQDLTVEELEQLLGEIES